MPSIEERTASSSRRQTWLRFTIWLHPEMVDIAKPVTIVVNGKTLFQDSVHPDLATALESYERRYDWGLVYPIKISLRI